jgi:hypothetical protein
VNGFRESLLVATATVLSCSGAPLARAEDIGGAQDLAAVIALNGKPCGRVANATKRGEDDYVATCEDGNRYRVYVKDGRVVVEKAN